MRAPGHLNIQWTSREDAGKTQEGEKPREAELWKLREERSFRMESVVHCFR